MKILFKIYFIVFCLIIVEVVVGYVYVKTHSKMIWDSGIVISKYDDTNTVIVDCHSKRLIVYIQDNYLLKRIRISDCILIQYSVDPILKWEHNITENKSVNIAKIVVN